MDLRPELRPAPVPAARLRELVREIVRIEELLHRGPQEEAEAAIAAFNADTGHTYGPYSFLSYAGSRSAEEFAREAARPAYPRLPDITREELVEVVRAAREPGPDQPWFLLLFTTNVADPGASDLIFHPPAGLEDASAERIVDVAQAYRPIAL
ncbi:hypothetical protein [Streptomyces justiciae]|uniref:hypothetical protein n=1 Tax=Streptomyces justiciae TaxID=2780140 RepID=UPI0018806FAF|nr:hypothetical protein [Streptomyces justiciae]MBE8470267.1 hypothetical protein [Streptomyces justiciae]MCW8376499.1 hypothetical protein [Streptomyces justiciae]